MTQRTVLILALAAAALVVWGRPTFSSETKAPVFLDLGSRDCSLRAKGKDRAVVFKGTRDKLYCNVEVPAAQFESRFSHCAVAGVSYFQRNANSLGVAGCGFTRLDAGGYSFNWSAEGLLSCDFVCMPR